MVEGSGLSQYNGGGPLDADGCTTGLQRHVQPSCSHRAQRYADHPALLAFEVLNEPRWDVEVDILERFYVEAYVAMRKHTDAWIIFHDAFRCVGARRVRTFDHGVLLSELACAT